MRKKKPPGEAVGFSSDPSRGSRLSPMDVQQKEFRLAFRGYNERDVDEFLDMVTEELASYVDENERLRQQVGLPPSTRAAVPGAGDEAGGGEEILADARERAAVIIREAEARAAAIVASAATGSVDHHAIISPYIHRERDFLKSLGQLVQDHAQTVRAMVEQTRSETEAPAASASEDQVTVPEADEVTEEASKGTTEEGATGNGSTGAEDAVASSESEGPSSDRVPAAEPEAARPLRELFWGED